jgi:catechol 2,3-dioxygenase-like lactoylglutathione lyase family enzyme
MLVTERHFKLKELHAMADTHYKVTYIRVGSSDLHKARIFYEDILGLHLISQNIDKGYLLFSLAGITLIVEKADDDSEICPCRYLGISLKVQNIFNVYETFSELGVKFSQPPEKQFWGGYLTEFEDPDNNVWTLLG